jgi:alpha-ribazole phosphatase
MTETRIVRWWWVRHAPSVAEGLTGWTDAPADLSDVVGLMRLRDALPEGATVISSDLSRAETTARKLTGRRLRGPAERAFREQFFGHWEGLSHDEIAEKNPEQAEAFWQDPANARPPGGESFATLCKRVASTIERLNGSVRSGDLAVVAHAGSIRAALAHALGLSPERALSFEIAPLSLTRLDRIETETGEVWRVGGVNMGV